ncbi:transposase [Pedobacter sp. KR3-3]|uniref:Transposase n=1 Tax=Pedobacter albus TaxID=3113905 RepID=A0ABU7IC20_9SPHI|nr:transposase [Pedobacter sp. KR3-3]MEE1946719.1 transposase [Pedobacter sp. KR3-3]
MKIIENSYYHIYNRGNNKNPIFFKEDNYSYFLTKLEKHLRQSCTLYAYCLMPNHFHLFLKVNHKHDFELGIKNFFISYTKSINKAYGRVGGLFQGRYRASVVNSDSYYSRVITYIHQNPLMTGLVKKLEDYRYSSYSKYLTNDPAFIDKAPVLDWFGGLDNFIRSHQIINTYEAL